MNKSHRDLIRKRYEDAVHEYCQAFCEKHEYQYDPDDWVGNDIGGIVAIGDYFVNFNDIRYDIDNDVPEDKFLHWYDYSLEIAMLDDGSGKMRNVNYKHWLMGARPYSAEDLEKIRDAKESVNEAERKFKELADRQVAESLGAQTDEMNFMYKEVE